MNTGLTPQETIAILEQDMRAVVEHQRVLSGLVDVVLEAEDERARENRLLRARVATLESEKAALLACHAELQAALKRIIQECRA